MFSTGDSDMKQPFGLGLPYGLTSDNKLTNRPVSVRNVSTKLKGCFTKARVYRGITVAVSFEQNPDLLPDAGHDYPEAEIKIDFKDF